MAAKSKVLGIAFILLVGLAILLVVLFRPSISIHREQKLSGPEEDALLLLNQNRPLVEIQNAVAESGKGVDEVSWFQGSLLYWATKEGRLDVADWLLCQGANPNGITPSMSPLSAALVNEDVAMVKLLVRSGADPDLGPESGITPRRIAETKENTELIEALRGNQESVPNVREPGKQDPNAQDQKDLQGAWTVISTQPDGTPRTIDKMEIDGHSVTFMTQKRTTRAYATLTLDTSVTPKTIDFYGGPELNEDFILRYTGIYSLEGDTLRLCIDQYGNVRPTSFGAETGFKPDGLAFNIETFIFTRATEREDSQN